MALTWRYRIEFPPRKEGGSEEYMVSFITKKEVMETMKDWRLDKAKQHKLRPIGAAIYETIRKVSCKREKVFKRLTILL